MTNAGAAIKGKVGLPSTIRMGDLRLRSYKNEVKQH